MGSIGTNWRARSRIYAPDHPIAPKSGIHPKVAASRSPARGRFFFEVLGPLITSLPERRQRSAKNPAAIASFALAIME